ncbi:H(+)/Cl(-) exchange transporter 7-like [Helicoverpa armigera]|uniref:H(+)/Cl(-) exchange transporter 7 n=1 Tax=Helicoverpa zea TaxID=7113 RepID=UPI001F58EF28|nr:H(+)/Cl(-) exchange transporter 7 [Helicoverpa zea]XP_049699709.1 H(+)/Cl(-) exchange transporter 7 isoform X1 [Helicoverpa armigera]XP_049699710.1 H(+)/Cl(-) exchange transporter 7 isoform X2 [Helicoverpa armigera]
MSHSSTSVAEGTASSISNIETTSDTAQLLSTEDPSTSNFTQLNKSVNFEDSDDDEFHGSHGVRRRQPPQKIEPGSMNVLSAKYESLDYDTCENHLLLDEERKRGYAFIVWKDIARWFIILLIGIITALIAFFIDICIEEFSKIKYRELKKSVDTYVIQDRLYIPYLLWVLSNICIVFIGSMLVAYVEPVAAGSGIPQVKCYLNGVKVPRVVRIKTLIVKAVGVITAVVGGLAGGKEGPMIHSGAVVAAGISQGKSTTFNKDFKIFQYFREDHEKRDFVSAGAAAGVSAAFGAPIGGVLFSLEEGTSFWNQALTWRTFFGTVVSTFTLNCALSAYHGRAGELSFPGLLNLGKMEPFPFQFYELPVFMFFGAVGGMLGALWNYINYRLTVFRLRYIGSPWLRVVEACLVAAASATCGFLMMFLLNDCRPLGEDPTKVPLQLYCADGEYNALAAIWFQTPEASVRSFLHDPIGSYKPWSILVFVVCYFLLSTWTFGLSVSSGLFIPNLLTGAAWGRLLAILIQYMLPSNTINPAKYALIGAAAQLGGVVRMTISLTVIIIETTGQISNALPIIITLVVAKWTGDFFNEGIYDIHIQLAAVPLLPWEPPPLAHNIYASEVMSHPVFTLRTVENVGHIVELLKLVSYNGFPVVDPPLADDLEVTTYKRLRGMILRSQLIVLIQNKLYNENANTTWSNFNVDMNMFRKEYPRYPSIDELDIAEWEKTCTIDLRPFMNPSPYTLPHRASLPRLFRLFRALGLRHLPIVNDVNEVVGMVTRKDIARYRVWRHRGHMGMEELILSSEI